MSGPADPLAAVVSDALAHIAVADDRFGPFTSTHEALGVLVEEWRELQDAIRDNDPGATGDEAIDLAAAALRLAAQCRRPSDAFRERSGA